MMGNENPGSGDPGVVGGGGKTILSWVVPDPGILVVWIFENVVTQHDPR